MREYSLAYGINVAKVNADDAHDLVAKYKVNAMPRFILLVGNIDNSVMSLNGTSAQKLEELFAKAKEHKK